MNPDDVVLAAKEMTAKETCGGPPVGAAAKEYISVVKDTVLKEVGPVEGIVEDATPYGCADAGVLIVVGAGM